MAKYSDIKGFTVQTLASDTVPSQFGGGAWSSAPDMNTGRQFHASGGPSTSAIVFAGAEPSTDYSASAETFNGTAFSSAPNMNEGRTEAGGFATSSEAAIVAGGYTTVSPAGVRNTCESFDGSSWTETADLGEGRTSCNGTSWGTTTAGSLVAGVDNGSPGTNEQKQEYWNGSSWSEQGDLNLGRRDAGGAGIQTAGLVGGGMSGSPYPGTITNNTESWNGSSWTEVAEMNASKRAFGSSFGTYTEAMFAGGQAPPPVVANCEYYNGSTWTEVADLSAARNIGQGFGLATDGYAYGGAVGGSPKSVSGERFEAPSVFSKITEGQLFFNSTANAFKETIRDIPAGSWATSGSLNSAHAYGTGFGLQTAAVSCFGAVGPSPVSANASTNTELYNGTSWTEVNEANTARRNMGSSGTQTSGLAYGGGSTPPIRQQTTESWNGTSWTSAPNLPTGVYNNRGLGTSSTSAISIGGVDDATPGKSKKAAEYDGTSWTSISDMGTIRESGGTSNAAPTSLALAFGGESPSLTVNNEEWNGSSWTEKSNMNTAKGDFGFNGISTSALAFAGSTPASPPYQQAICEFWNGTTWTELADLGTGIANGIAPAGGAVFGLASGGLTGPTAANTGTEEWTAALANKTITAS
jgi:hypothetical protein